MTRLTSRAAKGTTADRSRPALQTLDLPVRDFHKTSGIPSPSGQPLEVGDIVDLDMCWAFNLVDPWGNQDELNCYEYDRIKADLIQADGVESERYWPHELYEAY